MRLEQRIGRVDRIGQGRRVHVFHLVLRARAKNGSARSARRAGVAAPTTRVGASDPFDDRPAWTEDDRRAPRRRRRGRNRGASGTACSRRPVTTHGCGRSGLQTCRVGPRRVGASGGVHAASGLARTTTVRRVAPLIAWSREPAHARRASRPRASRFSAITTDRRRGPLGGVRIFRRLPPSRAARTPRSRRLMQGLDVPAQPGRLTWRDDSLRVHERFASRPRSIAHARSPVPRHR